MEGGQKENSEKRWILNELSKCLRSVYIHSSSLPQGSVNLNLNSPLIQSIDRALQHGLLNPSRGFWPLVQSFSHGQTLETINDWLGPKGPHRMKGQAWILATIVEGSLQSYLWCILSEPKAICHYYAPHAIVRDSSCISQLSSLLTSLETISLSLEVNFDFKSFKNPTGIGGKEVGSMPDRQFLHLTFDGNDAVTATTAMTSSITSSLASPGDSGFTQLDSETDTASFSEITLEADSSTSKYDVAVLPIDSCTEKVLRGTPTLELVTDDSACENVLSSPRGLIHNAQNPSESEKSRSVYNHSDEILHRESKVLKQQKRVSFHDDSTTVFHGDEIHPDSLTLKESVISSLLSAVNLGISEPVEEGFDTSLLEEVCLMEKPMVRSMHTHDFERSRTALLSFVDDAQPLKFSAIPVDERGIPEGQEDPSSTVVARSTSNYPVLRSLRTWDESQIFHNSSSDISLSCSSLRPNVSTPRRMLGSSKTLLAGASCSLNVLSQTPSKTCLVKRFLRSITEKRLSNCRAALAFAAVKKKESSVRKLKLFIPGAKPSDNLSQELLEELKDEMDHFLRTDGVSHSVSTLESFLCSCLNIQCSERVMKVFRVRDVSTDTEGRRKPLLALLTDETVIVIDCKTRDHVTVLFSQLSFILVGANFQWISLISKEQPYQINLLVVENDFTASFVSHIELAVRRIGSQSSNLPSVVCLSYEDLSKVPAWNPILECEKVLYYSIVHAVEEIPCSSLHFWPNMKAHFMFRINQHSGFTSWTPAFFVLKAACLFVFSDDTQMVPLSVINVTGIECHLVALTSRPHTIEVNTFQIAAPDDHVASDWLNALKRASLGFSNVAAGSPKFNISSGSLLLTKRRLMFVSSLGIPNEIAMKPEKPMLTAFVSDVSSLRFGGTKSCWCILEFSCREVHESSGDYILFFSSKHEMLAFRNGLYALNPILEKSSIVANNTESNYCDDISSSLLHEWDIIPNEVVRAALSRQKSD